MSVPSPSPLDLRGTPCPLNYIRTRLALERVPPGASLEVWLDRGEPERMVSEGLQGEVHRLELEPLDDQAVRLTLHTRAPQPAASLPQEAAGEPLPQPLAPEATRLEPQGPQAKPQAAQAATKPLRSSPPLPPEPASSPADPASADG